MVSGSFSDSLNTGPARTDGAMDDLIYLNNAATSYPKPPEVVAAVQRALTRPPGDESRGGGGEDLRSVCRQRLAELFGVRASDQVVLLPSATAAINLVVDGALVAGGHVVTTVLEHNSVLRPLAHHRQGRGVTLTFVEPAPSGVIDPFEIREAITTDTSLIVITHASNVCGAVQPVCEIAEIAAAAEVPLLIDASQSAGLVNIDHESLPGRVFVAFAGHKALLGPTGIGGLLVPDDELPQSLVGGTGVRSESVLHPAALPLRHEAGTPNFPGIAGLAAGVKHVAERGVENEGRHRRRLVRGVRDRLSTVSEVRLLPLADEDGRAGIVTFNVDGWSSEMLSYTLRESFSIETRSGLHCAPRAHEFFGCGRDGAVRVSFGSSNGSDDAEALVTAVTQVVGA